MRSETNSFYRYLPIGQRDKKWGLYITTAGEACVRPHAAYPLGDHPKGYAFDWQRGRILEGFALIYLSGGSGRFESKSNISLPVEAGQAFLLFPRVWHRYRPNAETGWHEHWVGFDGDIPRRWLRYKLFSAKNPVAKINAEDTVLATFSRMMQSIRANRPALQQILAGATDNLLALFYSAQQALPPADAHKSSLIELAINRIQNEFARELGMEALAQELGVSYSWFRTTFTAHTGLSPHQYFLEFRLAHARSLLAGTGMSIKEIATESGFGDEYYFSRLFRRKLNVSPSEWRRRSRRQ